MRFKSNEAVEKSGFKFTARIYSDCARNYTSLQGRFLTKKSDCDQYIHVPENYTITLYIHLADVLFNEDCTENNSALKVNI